jgi:hypothetical protein
VESRYASCTAMAVVVSDCRRSQVDGTVRGMSQARLADEVNPAQLRTAGEKLADQGRLLDAIDTLTAANRIQRDAEVERRLLTMRHDAFAQIDRSRPLRAFTSPPPDGPAFREPPVATPDELTPETLHTAIARHGCLLVRGLLPPARVDLLVEGIDRAFAAAAYADGKAGEDTLPWFDPFPRAIGGALAINRKWVREAGGVWTADSPRVMFELLETFGDAGLRDLITGYFGQRPAMSVNKGVLRKVPLDVRYDWHQDGAFLGREIRSVDVWLSLTHCGDEAPGLDIVPRRLDRIVEIGTEGAIFPWAVAGDVVDEAAGDVGVCRPIFEAGDALLFDHLLLHRTARDPAMTRERYAVETWFFAPSAYPAEGQIPLVY